MKRVVFILSMIIGAFIFGCTMEVSPPENLIERDKFIVILADIQIFESMDKIRTDRQEEGFEIDKATAWLFHEEGIDQESFQISFEYYAKDPKVFEKIYDEVIINISEREAAEGLIQ